MSALRLLHSYRRTAVPQELVLQVMVTRVRTWAITEAGCSTTSNYANALDLEQSYNRAAASVI